MNNKNNIVIKKAGITFGDKITLCNSCQFISMLLIIVCTLFPFSKVKSQVIKTEFEKIQQAYNKCENVIIKQEIKSYQNHITNVVFDTKESVIYKNGKNLYLNSLGVEKIINSRVILEVNNNSKTIIVDKSFENASGSIFSFEFDSLLIWSVNQKYTPLNDTTALIKLSFESIDYSDVEIFYNPKNHLIEKMVLYYLYPVKAAENERAQCPRIEIINKKVELTTNFDVNKFSEKKYISKSQGKYILNKQYTGYQLIDNSNEIIN